MKHRKLLTQVIRTCEQYENWKRSVFVRDRFTCQHCGARNGRKRVIEADHIVSLSTLIRENAITTLEEAINCSMLWDVNNGRTLCHACHEKTDSYPVNFRVKEESKMRIRDHRSPTR